MTDIDSVYNTNMESSQYFPLSVLLYLTVFLLLLLFVILIYISYLRWIYRHIPGPKPKSFFTGNVTDLREFTSEGIYYHFKFLQWAEEFGPLYKVFFFHKVMLVATGSDIIQNILTDSKFLKSTMIYKRVSKACGKRFLGHGYVTNYDHDNWKKRRSYVNPFFQKRYLVSLMDKFNGVADTWIQKLETLADGYSVVNMSDLLSKVTIEMIAQVAVNIEFNSTDDRFSQMLAYFDVILHGMSIANKDPLMNYKWKYRRHVKEVHKAVELVRGTLKKELTGRLSDPDVSSKEDILSLLIQTMNAMPEVQIDDLVDDFVTIFVAGQETTANSLGFLLMEIGRNSDVMTRLYDEVQRVVGDHKFITAEHLNQLEYMTMVFKESLRLYPPAPATVRDVPANEKLTEYKLPRDSTVIFPFFVIQRLSKYYDEPHTFIPERWSSSRNGNVYSYLPFSLGPRSCAGQQFAMIEAKVLLCKFLQRFHFSLDMEQSFDIQETTTLKPKGCVRMTLKCR